MTTHFTASNGDTIETRPDRWLVLRDDHYTEWVSPRTVDTLREYFMAERDEKLGRWRDPENPDYLAYLIRPSVVRVIDERYGTKHDFGRHDNPEELHAQLAPEQYRAAARYFAAHPEKKPWHDAKPGEVWVLETELHPEPRAFKVSSREGYATSNFTQVHNGQPLYTFRDGAITAGRRIWPEESDDGR